MEKRDKLEKFSYIILIVSSGFRRGTVPYWPEATAAVYSWCTLIRADCSIRPISKVLTQGELACLLKIQLEAELVCSISCPIVGALHNRNSRELVSSTCWRRLLAETYRLPQSWRWICHGMMSRCLTTFWPYRDVSNGALSCWPLKIPGVLLSRL